jgi:N6-L-threonylcarbamoyladenine synthase
MDKLKLAVKETGITQIAIGGGVSANSGIRKIERSKQNTVGKPSFQNLNTPHR